MCYVPKWNILFITWAIGICLIYMSLNLGIYHIRTNIGEELNLVNWRITTQSPSLNLANIFFLYNISVMTLVALERFHRINISLNPLFQQVTKYYIHQYLFLYSISGKSLLPTITCNTTSVAILSKILSNGHLILSLFYHTNIHGYTLL